MRFRILQSNNDLSLQSLEIFNLSGYRDGHFKMERLPKLRANCTRIPPSAIFTVREFQPWLFGYDAYAQVEEARQRYEREGFPGTAMRFQSMLYVDLVYSKGGYVHRGVFKGENLWRCLSSITK